MPKNCNAYCPPLPTPIVIPLATHSMPLCAYSPAALLAVTAAIVYPARLPVTLPTHPRMPCPLTPRPCPLFLPASYHTEVVAVTVFHFVKLRHNVTVFTRDDPFHMGDVMHPYFWKGFRCGVCGLYTHLTCWCLCLPFDCMHEQPQQVQHLHAHTAGMPLQLHRCYLAPTHCSAPTHRSPTLPCVQQEV